MIDDDMLLRMAKAPSTFPAHALQDALEELIARRNQEYVRAAGIAATRYPLKELPR